MWTGGFPVCFTVSFTVLSSLFKHPPFFLFSLRPSPPFPRCLQPAVLSCLPSSFLPFLFRGWRVLYRATEVKYIWLHMGGGLCKLKHTAPVGPVDTSNWTEFLLFVILQFPIHCQNSSAHKLWILKTCTVTMHNTIIANFTTNNIYIGCTYISKSSIH